MVEKITSVGNCTRIARPARSCAPAKRTALVGVTACRTSGRKRVCVTLSSMLRSQRSLIVHPAPRMMSAPEVKRKPVYRTEETGAVGIVNEAAISVDQSVGRRR